MRLLVLLLIMLTFCIGHSGPVDNAREQLINGDRAAGLSILLKSIQLAKSKKEQTKLQEELGKLSEVFLSDKSQKLYQQAKTLYAVGDKNYLTKLADAEKIEPANMKILSSKSWYFLTEKNCKKSAIAIKKIKSVNPNYHALQALEFYALICAGKGEYNCEDLVYNKTLSSRYKLLNLFKCHGAFAERKKSLKNYCDLIKLDVPNLPELVLLCSEVEDSMSAYNKSCENYEKKEKALNNVYPFVCDKKISSQIFKN